MIGRHSNTELLDAYACVLIEGLGVFSNFFILFCVLKQWQLSLTI